MMHMQAMDPDVWVSVVKTGGEAPNQWACFSWERRPPEETARLKAERKRAEEDAILERAERIRAERARLPG